VSGLWTPGGEHEPAQPSAEELAAAQEMAALQAQLAATPVIDVVANHAIGLWQLAVLHLGVDGQRPPNLGEAALSIDAMAALVEGLGDRLGDNQAPLVEALAQLRLAYVQVAQVVDAAMHEAGGEGAGGPES
jgi:hypothetical protein